MKQSPSFPAVCGTVRGGMTTQIETTQTEVRDNAYWPNETLLIDFVEKDTRTEQADQPLENNSEYATLYFVS